MADEHAAVPVHDLIARRFSPYAFSERPVATADLRALFEAARWAASSFNEQPWRYLIAVKNASDEFDRMLSCLVEANQTWASRVPVLAIGCMTTTFSRNNKPNRVAAHDLGLASAQLTFEATARGLCVHQMAGIDTDRIAALYALPEGTVACTGLAIGYRASPDEDVPAELRERDAGPRQRRDLGETVFTGRFGEPASL